MFKIILYDISNNNRKKEKIIALCDCKIKIDYGDKEQEIILEKYDEIKWDLNVIINMKNNYGIYCDFYKSRVKGNELKIYYDNINYLKITNY